MSEITTGAPAAPAAPASTTPAAPSTPAATTAAPPSTGGDWTTGFDDDTKGYVQNSGFKDPAAVVSAYRNLEKHLGVPRERILRLPEKEDSPEWGDIYNRLGRPGKPEEYKLASQDPEFVKWAQGTFHELGMSAKQAEKLVGKFNEYQGNITKSQQESMANKVQQEETGLKNEWGAAFDQNVGAAKLAANSLGFKPEVIDALEKQMGYAGVMKFMHSLGSKMGEDGFVSGQERGGQFKGTMTPEQARNQIKALRTDPSFVQKYKEGDATARAEMDKLHRWGYPDAN